jgi:redox-sensing transcriptional repressor
MTVTLPNRKPGAIPAATIARLPVYHRVLATFGLQGLTTIASEELAAACGVSSAKLRKDLSHLGSFGTRGVGYNVSYLTFQIARELGVTKSRGLVIVGMGNLGRALASYRAFGARGFHIVGIFDRDHELVGKTIECGQEFFTVMPVSDLTTIVSQRDVNIGVITTPAESAQEIADLMIQAGLVSILNFAPVVLNVPEQVEVRKVDLAVELQILAFHDQRSDWGHNALEEERAEIA